jgi:epoxyqueuosine reductase QueG
MEWRGGNHIVPHYLGDMTPEEEADVIEKEWREQEDTVVTVCDNCQRASCWQGYFYCDFYREAGTTQKTILELRSLNRESPHYWDAKP